MGIEAWAIIGTGITLAAVQIALFRWLQRYPSCLGSEINLDTPKADFCECRVEHSRTCPRRRAPHDAGGAVGKAWTTPALNPVNRTGFPGGPHLERLEPLNIEKDTPRSFGNGQCGWS